MLYTGAGTEEVPGIAIDWHRRFFLFQKYVSELSFVDIATLGPPGTSSEQAAYYLLASLNRSTTGKYTLCPSYEDAFERVATWKSDLLLVANAYAGIDKFYMASQTEFLFQFVRDTPLYGVAALPGQPLPERRLTVATHPAPSSLVSWFLKDLALNVDVVFVSSTSEAALAVRRGEADLCVTTSCAAEQYGLHFISPTRPICMLWSVFSRSISTIAVSRSSSVVTRQSKTVLESQPTSH
jgi:hypothetical protein